MPANPDEGTLTALLKGELTVTGEFLWGSNYTFFAEIAWQGETLKAVYKPTRGERPLWDFPAASLARREVAAYLVSEALGWRLVPPTVYRRKASLGAGSVQLFLEHDPEYHYFTFSAEDRQRLRPVAAFDLLVNNADRKGSHILMAAEGTIWLIDHGICFHVEDKLRTVLWDFAGEPLPAGLLADINAFRDKLAAKEGAPSELAAQLNIYLSAGEVAALRRRAEELLTLGCFPNPPASRRPVPWPPV
ncbi:MAG: SCO1664 family protein [Anaerolineales bacterium]|nr:SCO1664 family protein [Anaerolineales bacterium]